MAAQQRVELILDPFSELSPAGSGDNVEQFQSEGSDPQFAVAAPGGLASIDPGWWRITGRLEATDGAIVCPRFYIDHGDGYREEDCLHVRQPGGDGQFDCVVRVRAPIVRMRFDPTERPARFHAAHVSMQRISRQQALANILQELRRKGRLTNVLRWRGLMESARAHLRLPGDVTGVAALYDAYVESDENRGLSYSLWHRLFDPLLSDLEEKARQALAATSSPVALTLVVRTSGVDAWLLDRCIDSVLAQTWPHWELLVVQRDGTSPEAAMRLQRLRERDSRIKILSPGGGELADGRSANQGVEAEFVAFVDPHCVLARDALCQLACALDAEAGIDFIYSDSDCIDDTGRRFDPRFKPAWNRLMLQEVNYIGSMAAIRKRVLAQAAGRVWVDVDWGHGTMLQLASIIDPERVGHIPRVLFHEGQGCAAGAFMPPGAPGRIFRPRALDAAPGRSASPVPAAWPAPSGEPLVTIVIPTRDRLGLLRACVESVIALTGYRQFEVLVVDNGSTEQATLDYLAGLQDSREQCRVVRDAGAFNFSRLVNLGARNAAGSVLCLLNNDIEVVSAGWLLEMLRHASQDPVGAVGAKLLYPDDTIQHAGVILGIGGVGGHVHHRCSRDDPGYMQRAQVAQELSAVTAACMMVRKTVFNEVGGFDEALAVAFNDVDFCLKVMAAGYRNVWTPRAELYHHESASRGREDTEEKKTRFASEVAAMIARWGDVFADDPAYNPNLTLDRSHFELSYPPRLDPVCPPLRRAGMAGFTRRHGRTAGGSTVP
ncbi:MAG: glycosyltransferase family 2 protein [Chloroflexota bacterium]|nr:glycosyltransferase family 2 protein [Chloroflexota bacterium]